MEGYCTDCNKEVNVKEAVSHKEHVIIPLDEYYKKKLEANTARIEELNNNRRALDITKEDFAELKDLIHNKNKKILKAQDALVILESKIDMSEKEIAAMDTHIRNLIKDDNEGKEIDQDKYASKYSEVAFKAIEYKNELEKLTQDLNILCLGEALVLKQEVIKAHLSLRLVEHREQLLRASIEKSGKESKESLKQLKPDIDDAIAKLKGISSNDTTMITQLLKTIENTVNEIKMAPSKAAIDHKPEETMLQKIKQLEEEKAKIKEMTVEMKGIFENSIKELRIEIETLKKEKKSVEMELGGVKDLLIAKGEERKKEFEQHLTNIHVALGDIKRKQEEKPAIHKQEPTNDVGYAELGSYKEKAMKFEQESIKLLSEKKKLEEKIEMLNQQFVILKQENAELASKAKGTVAVKSTIENVEQQKLLSQNKDLTDENSRLKNDKKELEKKNMENIRKLQEEMNNLKIRNVNNKSIEENKINSEITKNINAIDAILATEMKKDIDFLSPNKYGTQFQKTGSNLKEQCNKVVAILDSVKKDLRLSADGRVTPSNAKQADLEEDHKSDSGKKQIQTDDVFKANPLPQMNVKGGKEVIKLQGKAEEKNILVPSPEKKQEPKKPDIVVCPGCKKTVVSTYVCNECRRKLCRICLPHFDPNCPTLNICTECDNKKKLKPPTAVPSFKTQIAQKEKPVNPTIPTAQDIKRTRPPSPVPKTSDRKYLLNNSQQHY